MTLFVDTSVWYAAVDSGDTRSGTAKRILSENDDLLTTDHVLLEAWLLMDRRLGSDVANRFWSGLRTGVAPVETVGPADLEVAWTIRTAFADQDFSFIDCTSFAVISRLGITRAASFDADFAVVRLGDRRDRALTLVR